MTFDAKYIVNDKGIKKSVVLPIREFEELLENLEDLKKLVERKEEETISHNDVLEMILSNEKV